MPIKFLNCTCSHVFQDKQYSGKRVMNKFGENDKKKFRCTVCGREHDQGGDDKKAVKK
jgi:hypothetical protein